VVIRPDKRDYKDGSPVSGALERLGFLWETPVGIRRVEPTDGLIVVGVDRYDVTWMPLGWQLESLIPLGFTRAHLDRWFRLAVNRVEELASAERDPDVVGPLPGYLAEARAWVAAGYILVRHLGFPGSPAEPRTPIDRAGCAAALRDAWAFLGRAMRVDSGNTSAGKKAGKATGQRGAKLRQVGRPTSQEDGPAMGRYLRYQGKEFDISEGVEYRLIAYMWPQSRESATYQELVDAGVFTADVLPKTIRTRACEVSRTLEMAGVPWRFSANAGQGRLIKSPRK
jgi:hypothetical protein